MSNDLIINQSKETTKNKSIYNSACKKLVFIILFMYGMMMCSKNIYTAEITVIQDFFGASSSNTSFANTCYYFFYGLLQCFLVLFIDKINLRKYLGLTVLLSALFTTFMGVIGVATKSLISVYVIFSLNGLCQAGMYASSMKIFAKNLPKKMLPRTNKLMSSVGIVANAISYGLSIPFAESLKWEIPFIIASLVFLLAVILFFALYPIVVKQIKQNEDEDEIINEQSLELKGTSNTVLIRGTKDVVVC
ncbi:MAG: MFS transporter [Clostridia bacterium]|nr:MFS transporter [Clostridia bacterium]